MTPRIEVTDLGLRYGNVTALDGLTFTLDGGKIYGLLGRNGSGKTSLLSVLAAFCKASAGTVRIDGQPVFENPRITRQVCLIRTTCDTLGKTDRVEAALTFAAHLRPNWDANYAAALAERLRLPLGKSIGGLSRGQRAALGAVLGLAARAPVTMFDESHLGMDAPSRYAFYDELLTDFIAHPRTIIISTHLIEEVSALFEEVLIIDEGRLVLHDEADALRSRGVAVTGPAEAVDRLVNGLTVLGERRLGSTKSTTIYGSIDDTLRDQARYRIGGWPQTLSWDQLFTSPGQFALILTVYPLVFAAWVVTGGLIAAGFYRLYWLGQLVTVPLGLALVGLTEIFIGSRYFGPFPAPEIELGTPLPVAVGLGAGGFLLGLAMTWALVRDVSFCNDTA